MKKLNIILILFFVGINISCAQEKQKDKLNLNSKNEQKVANSNPLRKIDYRNNSDKQLIKKINSSFKTKKGNPKIVIGNGYVFKKYYLLYGGDYGTNEFYELKVNLKAEILSEKSLNASDFWKIQNELKTFEK